MKRIKPGGGEGGRERERDRVSITLLPKKKKIYKMNYYVRSMDKQTRS